MPVKVPITFVMFISKFFGILSATLMRRRIRKNTDIKLSWQNFIEAEIYAFEMLV